MFGFPHPQYMPCADCGASVSRRESELHTCESERQLEFAFFQLRDEREEFDEQFTAYLESPQGRFEAWYAARFR